MLMELFWYIRQISFIKRVQPRFWSTWHKTSMAQGHRVLVSGTFKFYVWKQTTKHTFHVIIKLLAGKNKWKLKFNVNNWFTKFDHIHHTHFVQYSLNLNSENVCKWISILGELISSVTCEFCFYFFIIFFFIVVFPPSKLLFK